MAERYYAGSADLLRAVDRDPSGLSTVEEDLAQSAAKFLDVAEWPPEVLAAQELAQLGFYVQAPLEVQRHAPRLAEEFGVVSIAELGDYPDRAPVSVGAVITNLRIRTTKKGQRMAWLTLADGTGAIECAVFPKAYEQLGPSTALREGAFLVAGWACLYAHAVPRRDSPGRRGALARARRWPRVVRRQSRRLIYGSPGSGCRHGDVALLSRAPEAHRSAVIRAQLSRAFLGCSRDIPGN